MPLLQTNFAEKYARLSNSDVYEIDGFDLFVVVKTTQLKMQTGQCTCPTV